MKNCEETCGARWRLRKVVTLSAPAISPLPPNASVAAAAGRRRPSLIQHQSDFLIAKTVAFSSDDSCMARIVGPDAVAINDLGADRVPGDDKVIRCSFPVTALAFGPRPKPSLWRRGDARDPAFTLATGHRNGSIRLWDSSTTQILTTLISHTDQVNELMFVAAVLFSVGSDGRVKVWDAEQHHDYNMSCSKSVPLPLTCCAFNPVGNLLAVAGNGRDACVFDVDVAGGSSAGENRLLGRMKRLSSHLAHVVRIRYTADGAFLLTASIDTTVKMWDSYSGELARTFCHLNPRPFIHFPLTIGDIAVDSSGAAIASVTSDGVLRVWDPERMQLAVDPAGQTVAGFRDAEITQPHGRQQEEEGEGEGSSGGSRHSICFSNAGQVLVVADQRGLGHLYVLELAETASLTQLCRTAIRRSLHHRAGQDNLVDDLCIPRRLKKFLMYALDCC